MPLEITDGLSIPDGEISFVTSRSGGPGGQNVNKLETKVTVRCDLAGSPSVTDEQKEKIRSHLAGRISRDGVLQVASQRFRTQLANRDAAVERFIGLLRESLQERTPRKKTRVSRSAKAKRRDEKQKLSRKKAERRTVEI